MSTVTMVETMPRSITLGIYLSLKNVENKAAHNQLRTMQVANSVMQTSIDSLFTEDQSLCTGPAVEDQQQKAVTPHWLPSVANVHAPDYHYEDHMLITESTLEIESSFIP